MLLLTGLFFTAFLAATILPAQSELALATLAFKGEHSPLTLLLVATSGNVLGSCVNWLLGRGLLRMQDRFRFCSAAALAKASRHFQRFGVWSLLFAWVPIVGDPLTVAAGVMRTPFWQFVVLVTIGKAARYAAILFTLTP